MTNLRRWVLGYLAAAWLVIQVIDVLGDSWGLEPALEQRIQLLLVVGFFLVLGFAAFRSRGAAHKPSPIGSRVQILASLGGWIVAGLLLASLGFTVWSSNRTTWARTEVIPEAQRLADEGNYAAAVALAEEAERFLADDPALETVFEASSLVVTVSTTPSGADVYVKEYAAPKETWRHVGQTPVEDLRVLLGHKQWRLEKPGYESVVRAPAVLRSFEVDLDEAGTWPEGMVHVPARLTPGWTRETGVNLYVRLPDFYYDRYEVTNRQFVSFVEASGYENVALWAEMRASGEWPLARERFVDATGRIGPASWELGAPRAGEDDLPVSGVSWHEALAFCRSQGKSLPTLYHWAGSSGVIFTASDVAAASNFSSGGPTGGDESRSVGAFGAYDLAGNMREWIWNRAREGRLILGGAWNDPEYFLSQAQTFDSMDRSTANGFRCVLETGETPDRSLALAPVELNSRDYYVETPVSEAVFEVYRQQFAYDDTLLETLIEETGITSDGFPYEVVSFNPAYEGTRVRALIMFPNDTPEPPQAVVIFPGSGAASNPSVLEFTEPGGNPDYILRSGRAAVVPVLKGTYSRQDELESTWPSETKRYSEYAIRWVQDVSRTLDYLETRSDLDSESVAYLGFSWGGRMGPIVLAVENRFKVGILQSGGLASGKALPEVDQINYVTRVKTPVLMLNGLRDSVEPYETAQKPLYDLLGTPTTDKRHVTFEGVGHRMPRTPVVRETIDWLDRYLGPPAGS